MVYGMTLLQGCGLRVCVCVCQMHVAILAEIQNCVCDAFLTRVCKVFGCQAVVMEVCMHGFQDDIAAGLMSVVCICVYVL
jgi:hypothetical protein